MKTTSIYNTEHMGGLFKLILLRYKFHPDDRAILIVKNSGGRERLFQNLINHHIFDIILIHDGRIGMKSKTEEDSISEICNHFDSLLSSCSFFKNELTEVYTVHDCDNPFGVYLHLKGIPQTIVEFVPGQFDNDSVYDVTFLKGKSSKAYSELQKKSRCLNGGLPEYTQCRCGVTDGSPFINYDEIIANLDNGIKKTIVISMLDDAPDLCDAQLLLANSNSFNRYISLPEYQKSLAYQLIADYIFRSDKPLVVKPHPEGLGLINDHFPDEMILDGSIPIDVIRLMPDLKMGTIVTVASSGSRQFEGISDKILHLGMKYFANVRFVNIFYSILRTVFRVKIRKIVENIFSEDFLNAIVESLGAQYSEDGICVTIHNEYAEFCNACRVDENSLHAYVNDNSLDISFLPFDIQGKVCLKVVEVTRADPSSIISEGIQSFILFTGNISDASVFFEYNFIKINKYSKCKVRTLDDAHPHLFHFSSFRKKFEENFILMETCKQSFNDVINHLSLYDPLSINEKVIDSIIINLKSEKSFDLIEPIACFVRYGICSGNKLLIKSLVRLLSMEIGSECEMDQIRKQFSSESNGLDFIFTIGQYESGLIDLDQAIEQLSCISEKSDPELLAYSELLLKRCSAADIRELEHIFNMHNLSNGALYYNYALYFKKIGDMSNCVKYMRQSKLHKYWRANNELINVLIQSNVPEFVNEGLELFNNTDKKAAGNYYVVGNLLINSSEHEEVVKGLELLECGAKMGNKNCIILLRKARGI